MWWHTHFLWNTTNPDQLDLRAQRTQPDEELSWSSSARDQMNHIKCDHYGAEDYFQLIFDPLRYHISQIYVSIREPMKI